MKKSLQLAAMACLCTLFFASCNDDDEVKNNVTPISTGLYIVNSGSFYSGIDGTLSYLDYNTSTMSSKVFSTMNERSLGNTPQDAVVYGSKMYIAVYGSNTIEVINKSTGKSMKQILPTSSQGEGPRSVIAANGKVYVSMYDGYVSRIDTTSLTIDATIAVGPNPEIMAVSNGYLYVPNSDGLNGGTNGKSVSKIDLSSFKEVKKIPVGLNPTKVCADANGNLFVLCMGDYASIAASIQKISSSDEVTDNIAEATLMTVANNTLYLINAPFGAADNKYFTINTTTNTKNETMVDEKVDSPCAIAVDPVTGKIFISSYNIVGGYASYSTDGYINEYTSAGVFTKKYTTGIGPCGLNFVTNLQ